MPRRAGKDMCAFNIAIRFAIRNICVIYYILPTYSQGRKIIFDSITNSGDRVIDYIPKTLVASINSQEMKIRLTNGSLLQVVGSDNIDSLVGTNPKMCIFSEYALQDPRAYQFIRPILAANDGIALFISTPRGKNHLYTLYEMAKQLDDWFCYKLTLDDTLHIPYSEIEKDRIEGIMSEDLIQQEYYTSFDLGVEGAYYAKYMDRMRVRGQISQVPHEAGFKVHTAWDLGVRDSTCIIFFQNIGNIVRIIDCYEKNKEGLEHYINVLQSRASQCGYVYGRHIAPHDIAVREFGTGMTRIEKAKQLGLTFTVASNIGIEDGIEAVRSALSKIWIDEVMCKSLIRALENYRQEYDSKRKVYKTQPLHDNNSHFCFAGDTLVLTRIGMRQIMLIEENEEVLTLQGWRKCSRAQKKKEDVSVVEVTFKCGMKVKCTPDHLFATMSGWKSAELLMRGTEIQSSLMKMRSILMEFYTDYLRMRDIILTLPHVYIGRFGKEHLDRFLRDAIYITEMVKYLTIAYPISNAYPVTSTLQCLSQIIKDFQEKLEVLPMSGTDLQREFSGIKNMLESVTLEENLKGSRGYVAGVEIYLTLSFEIQHASRDIARLIVEPLIIESVVNKNEKIDVWDVTVPGIGHFSLSNGAIVHNSDCMRYLCVSLPKTRDGLSPEDLERRYQEAVMGNNYNMPSVFRDDLPIY